ncbi:MAG: hypothetical protein ACTTIC_08440 [Helicobacteraceae bacterium]
MQKEQTSLSEIFGDVKAVAQINTKIMDLVEKARADLDESLASGADLEGKVGLDLAQKIQALLAEEIKARLQETSTVSVEAELLPNNVRLKFYKAPSSCSLG